MFKSIKDFDMAMHDILLKIRDGADYGELSEKFGEENYREALGKCVELRFINGMTAQRDHEGNFEISTLSPVRLTYEGLRYVDSFARA